MATGALIVLFWAIWLLVGAMGAACFVAGFKAAP